MPRRVLAMLLCNPNRPVSTDAIIEELWEDNPPKLARKTVQTYVYQLRKELNSRETRPVVETCRRGYLIRLESGELDLWEFEARAAAAKEALRLDNAPRAAEEFRSALSLWRGPALSDLLPGARLAARIAHLEETRLRVLEQRVELSLHLGEHRDLIGELNTLTAEHPLHEGFHAQLMVALSRSGDRNEALRVYQRLRRRMVEELGLDPSERLQRLHQSVMRGEADELELPSTTAFATPRRPASNVPAQLPRDIRDFVGREAELKAIDAATRANGPDTGTAAPVVVVTGQPGVGKTTLAVRAGQRMREHFVDGQLFATLRSRDGAPVAAEEILGSFLVSLGCDPEHLPRNLHDRMRAFRSWAAERRVLVVLDDAVSVEQTVPLLPGGAECAVLITAQEGLPGLPGVDILELEPFTDQEGLQLLVNVVGRDRVERETESALQVVRLCERLPLAVRAAGEKLAARPPWSIKGFAIRLLDEDRRLDELRTGTLDIRTCFARAYRRLGPPH
ncbi:AfsR/SARP family transcriptional regulator, partial [Thermobifida halotolerans]|uniref:AfsR/SARP family transcriptional regulator n=1 Tax=Thermobifida halotolerans TaxID=483545 RepID=UPI00373FE3EB